jgi:hypothetical protein
MGSERTDFMWVKPFSTKHNAKAYAEECAERPKDKVRWQGRGKTITWDSGPYYFTIKEEKVL